jgi:hypothetical protein
VGASVSRRAAIRALWCAACAHLVACGNLSKENRAESPKPRMNGDDNKDAQCVGRFRLSVPEGLAVTGRSQSIYRVDVSTVPLPSGGAEAVWNERLPQIRALKAPPGTADVIVRTFELEPGVPAVWYKRSPESARLLALEAMKAVGNHVLLVSRGAEAGHEADIETLVKIVIDAYVPSTNSGFCVGSGSITSEPSQSENASISFVHQMLPDITLSFETQTVREPNLTNPLDGVERQARDLAAKGGQLKVLRNDVRSAAGLKGMEGWISITEPGKQPLFLLAWHFQGVGGRSDQPDIALHGEAHAEHQAEMETIWEGLLKSLQAVPLSPKAPR